MPVMNESVYIPGAHRLVFGVPSDSAQASIYEGASHTLYITGDISLRGTSVGDVLDFTNVTRASGKKYIRMGTYTDPTLFNGTGLFQAYSLATTATGAGYLFFFTMRGTGAEQLIGIQMTVESESVLAVAPSSVIGLDMLVGLTQATSCLATAGSDHTAGMFGAHLKSYCVDGATVASGARVAAVWLDGQLNGSNISSGKLYYDIYATSGGSAFTSFARLQMIGGESAGWTNLFSFNFSTQPPFAANSVYKTPETNLPAFFLTVDVNGTPHGIPLMAV